MTEINIVETGFEKATHDWLVTVGSGGMSRIVATCPYPQYAEVVAKALGKLTDDELEALGNSRPDEGGLYPFRKGRA